MVLAFLYQSNKAISFTPLSTAKAFIYLLANQTSNNCIHEINLPHNQGKMINGHFAYDSFLILREDEKSISIVLNFLDTFCKALGSSI